MDARVGGLIVLAASALAAGPSQSPELAGTWVGSGTLTNNWAAADNPRLALTCVYTGKAQPPSMTLSLPSPTGEGTLTLNIPSGSPSCPPLRKRFQIRARIAGTRMTFTDPAGDRWSLSLTDDLLGGEVTWIESATNPGEALALGFNYRPPLRPWDVPLTRLTGKVTFRRAPAADGAREPAR